jgi:phospholipase/carboxylesterase
MKVETFGELEAVVAGGTDGEGGGDGPVVVLLHGFGAPGDNLVDLWRYLPVPKGTRFVFPAAPIDLTEHFGMEARAWWMIDMFALQMAMREGRHREVLGAVPEGLEAARAKVIALLDEVEARMRPSKILLGGFSQGAMLSLDVALHDPRPLAGLALFSTTFIAESVWPAKMPSRSGTKVVQSHGTQDPILPFVVAETLRDRLREAGLTIDFVPFRGGHQIPPVAVERFGALAHDVLG